MSRIRILSERVANQIAAGEVVERPAAAVKELVENALDAGATRIEVKFRGAGRELIRVEDDGQGMDRDDALLALQRHATSKIAEAEDLRRLGSFGFRGEALPSIASVARFVLQTRAASSDAGTEVVVNAGKLLEVRECGRPVGTSVEVAHLFHPVPARRRFLKSDATESAHIVQVVRGYALAFPGVHFSLAQDGRDLFRSPQCPSLAERVGEIFGLELAAGLVPIEAAEGSWGLTGLVGRPGLERSGRRDFLTFVNNRPVESQALSFAVDEGYRESLTKGKHPTAFLFLTCDPDAVDVNVHPTKREVRFRQERVMREFVARCVAARLRALGGEAGRGAGTRPAPGAPALEPFRGPHFPLTPRGPGGGIRPAEGGGIETAAPGSRVPIAQRLPIPFEHPEPPEGRPDPAVEERPAPEPADSATGTEAGARTPAASASPPAVAGWRWLGLVQGAYAVFETASGLVLLDLGAAWERVWYERLKDRLGEGPAPCQRLLLPIGLELDPIASALLIDGGRFLAAQGFEVAEFGRHYFRIEATPDWLEPGEAEAFVREVLEALREGRIDEGRPDLAREALARMGAARVARRRGAVTEPEARRLLDQLFAAELPLTSPAGRPTFVELNWNELARRFRKG
ncbi:MAG: DNA mismatch repair endonuclease MutL [Opitutaceae bacterium]